MKVRLLNNGGYIGLGNVEFPVVVEAKPFVNEEGFVAGYEVPYRELLRIGAVPDAFDDSDDWYWAIGFGEVKAVE